jgi:peptide-methionine (S)-S-oxide reductase
MKNPTYENLGGHSEAIQIDYDPAQISYEELLEVFWDSHNPTSRPWSRQYMPFVFYHNEEQKRLALETKDREAAERGRAIFTEIIPALQFYLAEDYHQKYRLRQVPEVEQVFKALYPNDDDFVNSTAAARVNGYLGGYGTLDALETELEDLDLSPEATKELLAILRTR